MYEALEFANRYWTISETATSMNRVILGSSNTYAISYDGIWYVTGGTLTHSKLVINEGVHAIVTLAELTITSDYTIIDVLPGATVLFKFVGTTTFTCAGANACCVHVSGQYGFGIPEAKVSFYAALMTDIVTMTSNNVDYRAAVIGGLQTERCGEIEFLGGEFRLKTDGLGSVIGGGYNTVADGGYGLYQGTISFNGGNVFATSSAATGIQTYSVGSITANSGIYTDRVLITRGNLLIRTESVESGYETPKIKDSADATYFGPLATVYHVISVTTYDDSGTIYREFSVDD